MMKSLVNTTLTPEEQRLGFERVWILNEKNRFGDMFAEPHIIQAVAYKVKEEESVWIFKMAWPDGRVYYSEMQYGVSGLAKEEHPDWHNVRASNWEDPVMAIRAATELPRDLKRTPVKPPTLIQFGEERRILFDAAHVPERDIQRNEGERVKWKGRPWISFPVRQ